MDLKTLYEAALAVVKTSQPYLTPNGPVERWWMVPLDSAQRLCDALGVRSIEEVELSAREVERWR